MNDTRFPIAIFKPTGELVNILDVPSGGKCNCICYKCKEYLIAINKEENKQRPHFRHEPGSNCNSNFESYIHWLAKEVIRTATHFDVPEITSKLIFSYSGKEFFNKIQKLFKKYDIPEPFRQPHRYNLLVQKRKSIKVESCSTESTLKSSQGSIRVDVLSKSGNHNFLIEPFYTNPINKNKKQKIKDLNETVIDINLRPFGPGQEYSFTLEEFKRYVLTETNLKSWFYLKTEKIHSLERILLRQIEEILVGGHNFFKEFQKFDILITEEEINLNPINFEIDSLEKQLSEVRERFGKQAGKIQELKEKRIQFNLAIPTCYA